MPQHFTLSKALRVTRALRLAVERLEINNCEGEEDDHIHTLKCEIARMYEIPAVRAAMDAEDADPENVK